MTSRTMYIKNATLKGLVIAFSLRYGTVGHTVINLVIPIDWPQDQKQKVQVVAEQSDFTNGSLSYRWILLFKEPKDQSSIDMIQVRVSST